MIVLNSNEYFSGLENFILFMRMYATNTSKKEKSLVDELASETLEYGDRKVYPFAALPKVEDYSLTSSLLTNKPTQYSEEFIGSPIKKKIPLSTIEAFMKMAMMDAAGMAMFMGYVVGLMESAKEDYLYTQIMSDLLSWQPTTNVAGKEMKKTITLLDPTKQTLPSEIDAAETLNQKNIEKLWQKTFDDFQLYTDIFLDIDNNPSGGTPTNFKSAINLEDMIFIGNAKYLNDQILDLMATLLKSDVIDKNFRRPYTLKIPQRTFDDNNQSSCIGFVAHRRWYQWFYHFTFMGSFKDIDTLMLKRVLHFWYSKGKLKNLPVMRLDAVVSES